MTSLRSFFTILTCAVAVLAVSTRSAAQNTIYFYCPGPGDLDEGVAMQWSSESDHSLVLPRGDYIKYDGNGHLFALAFGEKSTTILLEKSSVPQFVRCSLSAKKKPVMKETDLFEARSILGEIMGKSGESLYDSLSDLFSDQFRFRSLSEIELQGTGITNMRALKCGDSVFVSLLERPSAREVRNCSVGITQQRAMWVTRTGTIREIPFPELKDKRLLGVARQGTQFYFQPKERGQTIRLMVRDRSGEYTTTPAFLRIEDRILSATIRNDTLVVISASRKDYAVHVTMVLDLHVVKKMDFPVNFILAGHGSHEGVLLDPDYGNSVDDDARATKISYGKNCIWITVDKELRDEVDLLGTSSTVTRLDLKTGEVSSKALFTSDKKHVCTNVMEPYVFWMNPGTEIQILDFNSWKVLNRIPLTCRHTDQPKFSYQRYSAINFMEYRHRSISPTRFNFFAVDRLGADSISLRVGVHIFNLLQADVRNLTPGEKVAEALVSGLGTLSAGVTNYASYSYLNGTLTGGFDYEDHQSSLNKTMDDYELDYWIADRAYVRFGKSMMALYHETGSNSIKVVWFEE